MTTSATKSSPRTTVTFRAFSPNLSPEEVTRNLGEIPDHVHHPGDHPKNNPKFAAYRHGMWLIHSKVPADQPLEVHLDSLLSILEPKQAYVRTLAQHATIDFYCVLFWQSGFELSPQTLKRLANLEATFGVVVYPDDSGVPALPEEAGTPPEERMRS